MDLLLGWLCEVDYLFCKFPVLNLLNLLNLLRVKDDAGAGGLDAVAELRPSVGNRRTDPFLVTCPFKYRYRQKCSQP